MDWLKKYTDIKLLILLAFLASAIFTFQLEKDSFWLDEIYSVRYATHFSTFSNAVMNGASSERNMWLYYVLLYVWAHLGSSEFIIRLLSVIFGILGVLTTYFLGKEVYGRRVGFLAGVLLIFNTFYIQYAQEARAYSLLLFTFSLSTFFMYRLGKEFIWKNGLFYFFAGLAAIFTHVFSIFFLGFQGLYLLWQYRTSSRRSIVVAGMGTAFLVTLFVLVHNPGRQVGWIPKPQWLQFPMAFIFFSAGFGSACVYALTIGLSLIKEVLRDLKKKKPDMFFWYLVVVAIVPVTVVFLFSVFGKPIFIYRYMIYAVPAIILLFSRITVTFNRTHFFGLLILLCIFQANILRVFFTTPQKEQWREAVRAVAADAKPNDLIIIYPAFLDGPYTYYREQNLSLKAIKTIAAFPEDQALNTPDLIEAKIDLLLREVPSGGGVWVVSRKENLPAHRTMQKQLLDERLVRAYGNQSRKYTFYQLDLEYFFQK